MDRRPHGHLADEATVELMAEHDVWWSMQPFLDDDDAIPMRTPAARVKQLEVSAGTDRAYELARTYGVKLAWGTDTLFDAGLAARHGKYLAKMTRWFWPTWCWSTAIRCRTSPSWPTRIARWRW